MKYSELEFPSNRKFGFFFTFMLFIAAGYFFVSEHIITAYVFIALAAMFLIITIVNADILFFLNKLWMQFGYLIGMIISPIILAIIFFALVTPYSLVMRIFGRDELRLKLLKRDSYWKSREQIVPQTNFKQQF